MTAPTAAAVRDAFSGFFAFEQLPDWWGALKIANIREYQLGDQIDERLANLVKEAASSAKKTTGC